MSVIKITLINKKPEKAVTAVRTVCWVFLIEEIDPDK